MKQENAYQWGKVGILESVTTTILFPVGQKDGTYVVQSQGCTAYLRHTNPNCCSRALETTDFHGGNRCKTDVDVQKPVTQ
jgi:hypothetical protein